jgi:hypothetical protein
MAGGSAARGGTLPEARCNGEPEIGVQRGRSAPTVLAVRIALKARVRAGPGASTLSKPENCELARKFCMLGGTNEDLAGLFKVACCAIDEWIATIPEFAGASAWQVQAPAAGGRGDSP